MLKISVYNMMKRYYNFFIKQSLMGYLSQIRKTTCITTQRHVEINGKNKKKLQ